MAPGRDRTNSGDAPTAVPTSLLWAHQMKRENALLMGRMKKLEEHLARFETEAAAKDDGGARVSSLEKRLDAVSKNQQQDDEKLRKETLEKFENLQGDVEAITLQIAALVPKVDQIQEVEQRLKEYELWRTELGRFVDEEKMGQIRERLRVLSVRIDGGEQSQQDVRRNVEVLEEVASTLKKGYEELQAELKEIAARPMQHVVVPAADPGPHERPSSALQRERAPKKAAAKKTLPETTAVKVPRKTAAKKIVPDSAVEKVPHPAVHSVRGPDGRFIRAGAAPETQSAVANAPSSGARGPKTVNKKADGKNIVRSGPGWIEVARTPSNEAASDQETSGPDFVAPNGRKGKFAPRAVKAVQSVEKAAPVKRGRGRPKKDQTSSSAVSAAPGKRGPGRPRKHPAATASSSSPAKKHAKASGAPVARGIKRKAPAETQEPATRSMRSQATSPAAVGNEQNNRGGDASRHESDEAAPAGTNEAQEQRRTSVFTPRRLEGKHVRRGLTGIFTSPLSSPPSESRSVSRRLDFTGKGKQPVRETENAVQMRPAKRPRFIPQPDDDDDVELGRYLKEWSTTG